MIKFMLCILAQEHHRNDAKFVTGVDLSHAGDVNFDHLVKMMSAKFLHCKVTILPFSISKYLMGGYFETV